MKTYMGDRTIDGVRVTVDGAALDPCTHVMEFTKNGFEWSYEGPEPRQLALALLVDHLGDDAVAKVMVEPFMRAIVANFGNEWEMTSADLDLALTALADKVGSKCCSRIAPQYCMRRKRRCRSKPLPQRACNRPTCWCGFVRPGFVTPIWK
jgi:hypothetical protein